MIDEVVCGLQIDEIGAAIESDESNVADKIDKADKSDKADEADEVDETGVSIEMLAVAPILPHKIFRNLHGSKGIFWNK